MLSVNEKIDKSCACCHFTYRSQDEKINIMTCASNKEADQPVQSGQSTLASKLNHSALATHRMPSQDSDETARMCRLNLILTGHTFHKVHFVTL